MFLTPEEKLLKLRKKYKITQRELSEGEISRAFLAMIETHKKNLTNKTAKLMCDSFNRILKSRGIDAIVSYDELMETKEMQGEKYLQSSLAKKEFDFWKIELALYEVSPKNRIEFCEKIAEHLKISKNLELSKYYFTKALVETTNIQQQKEIILEISRLNYFLENYSETINLYNSFNDSINNEFNETSERIIFNYGHALKKLKKYEETKNILTNLAKSTKTKDLIFKSKNILAYLAYEFEHKYEKALKLYKELIDLADINQELILYVNLLKLELNENNIGLIKLNLEKIGKLKVKGAKVMPETDIEIAILTSEAFFKLNKIENTKDILWKAYINNRETINYLGREINIILKLHQFLTKDDIEKVEIIKNNALSNEKLSHQVWIAILYYYDKHGYTKEKEELFQQTLSLPLN